MSAVHDLLRSIGIVALAFVIIAILAFVLWLVAIIRDGTKRREGALLARRVTEDEARARLMGDQFDGTKFYETDCPLCRANNSKLDDTKTWPGPGAAA